uniref:Tachykinin-related peptide 3 n=1 Tax=Oncopeltus fasciatus TaxID=7536 RepID=TRP3_ONCFA|nr:RecName: Full=Tachykinin-related peptide 3; Short=TKRP-3 [Oncopeltus fasciatus]
APSSGFFGTR